MYQKRECNDSFSDQLIMFKLGPEKKW